MALGNVDFGLLIKILGLTQSANDAEALAAVRKANDMLKRASMQWGDLFNGAAHVRAAPRFDDMATFQEEILRQATANARSFNEAMREKQRARDAKYQAEPPPRSTGWTEQEGRWSEKGPFDNIYTNQHAYTQEPEPDVDEVQAELKIEAAAREMVEHLTNEEHQLNLYVFAMSEPDVAQWLFRLREGHVFHRLLFRQVCERGELGQAQLDVCEKMMRRDAKRGV